MQAPYTEGRHRGVDTSRSVYRHRAGPRVRVILAGMAARAGDVFVGRVRELVELERVLDATLAGSGSTVLLAGEAGIGKTRLAAEVARRAGDAGFEVRPWPS